MANPLGSTPGIIVGVGVGTAASVALEPAIELPKQNAWARNANRVLPVATMAALVAQGGVELGTAHGDGAREGFSPDKVNALVYLAQTVPGFAQSLAAWRRNAYGNDERGDYSDLWTHSLRKEGLDARYLPYLNDLFWERLSPQDLAYAVVRGLVPDAGLLPVAPPTSGGTVPRFPVANLDTLAEAQAHGYDAERFRVLVGRSGLSIAPGMAANALFRGLINESDYYLAVAEGDLRNEWRDVLRDVTRQILTSHDAAELQLRGYLTRPERLAKTQAHGMSDADSDLLYDLLGRSIPVHQITTGEARGGTFDGPIDTIPKAYIQSLERGNLRPEYYNLAYANRYTIPSYFVLRALLQAKILTETQGADYFRQLGWPPDLADAAAKEYAGGTTAAADPHVSKAQTQLWNTVHSSYKAGEINSADASNALPHAGVAAAAVPEVLAVWNVERSLIRAGLSASNIAKAYRSQVQNPATGAAWTQDEAIAALMQLGWSREDAITRTEI